MGLFRAKLAWSRGTGQAFAALWGENMPHQPVTVRGPSKGRNGFPGPLPTALQGHKNKRMSGSMNQAPIKHVFDMDDRARLPWRFFGASLTVLASL